MKIFIPLKSQYNGTVLRNVGYLTVAVIAWDWMKYFIKKCDYSKPHIFPA